MASGSLPMTARFGRRPAPLYIAITERAAGPGVLHSPYPEIPASVSTRIKVRPSLSCSAWIFVTLVSPSAGAASARYGANAPATGVLRAVLRKLRRVSRIPIVEQGHG